MTRTLRTLQARFRRIRPRTPSSRPKPVPREPCASHPTTTWHLRRVQPAGADCQRRLRLSIRTVMDGIAGVGFEQIQQGQAVRHHQSRYRQIRFGMRHVHHRQGYSQLEQVEFRLELHPGRHALFRRHELRGWQCELNYDSVHHNQFAELTATSRAPRSIRM